MRHPRKENVMGVSIKLVTSKFNISLMANIEKLPPYSFLSISVSVCKWPFGTKVFSKWAFSFHTAIGFSQSWFSTPIFYEGQRKGKNADGYNQFRIKDQPKGQLSCFCLISGHAVALGFHHNNNSN